MSEDPFRLRCLKGLTTVLEGIMVLNGYKHDLAGKVFRGRMIFGEGDPIPMLSILEPPLAPDTDPVPRDAAIAKGEWDLLIQGFVDDDKANPTDPAYKLMADVKQCLAKHKAANTGPGKYDLLGMGKKVDKITIGGGVVRPSDEISSKAYFWLVVTLEIAEDLDAPYA